ncbi:MAG TPA: tetratricopeptide repeat protein [Terriglobales bacterium]|nr:tetratricopeptide repeat protein [Terriglobales bacterium]
MKHRAIAIGAGLAVLALALTGTAEARNPNCAGGIQYVVQGMRDKEKGNLDDYRREMSKAVDRLSACATEDPEDLEALAYLGWAYAEVDSCGPAGRAFQKAIDGLRAKGDKKVSWAESNRESYWAKSFNQGIGAINTGQGFYPDFTKAPADETEKTLKDQAQKKYEEALAALSCAVELKPGDPKTIRNLATVHALTGDLVGAESILREGLKSAPGDTDLTSALGTVRKNYAGKLIEEKKYEQAITFYADLAKTNPQDADAHLGMADAYFNWALAQKSDSARASYKAAGDEYAKAAGLRPGEADLLYNAALSHQNANDFAQAGSEWREYLKLKPDDVSALSAFGAALAELKKYDDAAEQLHKAVMLKPKDGNLHRQLGGVYARADNQTKSYEEMVVYLAIERGQAAPDAAEAAKKAPANSDAAKTLASLGAPDELRFWEAEGQKYETWLYWGKSAAYTFRGGQQVVKTDWGAAPPKLSAAPQATKPATGKKK